MSHGDSNPSAISDPIKLAEAVMFRDPKMAYHLLYSRARPKSYQMTFTFNEGTINKEEFASMANKINCDFIAYDLNYTIRRPLYLENDPLKPQADAFFLTVPYMSIWLEVDGCPEMPLTDDMQPLETICRPVNQPRYLIIEPFPFALPGMETLKARVQLDKNFNSDPEVGPLEVPMELIITMYGYALTCQSYERISLDDAIGGINKFFGNGRLNRDLLQDYDEEVEMALRSTINRPKSMPLRGLPPRLSLSKKAPKIIVPGDD